MFKSFWQVIVKDFKEATRIFFIPWTATWTWTAYREEFKKKESK